MRILYHHRIGSKDGQAVHLEELITALRDLGHQVLLVGPEAFARASFGHDPKGLSFLKKYVPKLIYETVEIGYSIVAYVRLRRACRTFRPDFIYERYNLYLFAGVWCKKVDRVPLVLEVNAPLAQERARYGGLGLRWLAHFAEKWVWRRADFVLPVTKVLAGQVQAAGVPAHRICVIPNAIDPAKFAEKTDGTNQKAELGLSGKLVLGFTGFVRDWHGLDTVITMLAKPTTPNHLHLLIIGEGDLESLRNQAAKLEVLDRITFAGLVARDNLPRIISAFDIALLPKCVDYCSPLKMFEYMAAGKAIVAPEQSNIREILEPSVSCLMFTPENMEAMVDAILRLSMDGDLRSRLGNAARDLIFAGRHTWRQNAERVLALGATAARPQISAAL